MKLAVFLSIVGILFSGSSSAAPIAPDRAAPPIPETVDDSAADEQVDAQSDELGLTPADYATDIDYDVTYDDSVAQSYDDGYDPRAHEQFRDTLAPYGTWVDDPAYGEVWVPSPTVVGDDFSPYVTNGSWTDSEYGWTWVSGWTWGWAPFHYGRWTTVANHGWAWVPGTIWGPSWVAWRVGAGAVGWAPLPPRGVRLASPLGSGSPWRFKGAASFGQSPGGYLAPTAVPRIFGRMSVVSNARSVGTRGASTRVNAGPVIRGEPAPARLASVAPGAVPQLVVQPRAGAPLASRSWVRAGVTGQLAFSPAFARESAATTRSSDLRGRRPAAIDAQHIPVRSYIPSGRGPTSEGRSYTLGAGPTRGWRSGPGGPVGGSPFRAPAVVNQPAGAAASLGWFAYPMGRSLAPRAYGATTGATTHVPPAPQWTAGVPNFTAAVPSFTAAPASSPAFHGGHSSWGSAGSASSGTRSSFGGGGHAFGGGGRHR